MHPKTHPDLDPLEQNGRKLPLFAEPAVARREGVNPSPTRIIAFHGSPPRRGGVHPRPGGRSGSPLRRGGVHPRPGGRSPLRAPNGKIDLRLHRSTWLLFVVLAALSAGPAWAATAIGDGLPYVYTNWQQFTTADGLPDDHIFAVKAAGPFVWIGTEDGLARYNKKTGSFRTWGKKEGLPWPVVSAIDVNQKTGEVWVGMFGGGLARLSGGRFDHFHQLNSGLVNDVVYGVCVENDNVWAATTAGASRLDTRSGKWSIYTEQNAPMEEIWNYGCAFDEERRKLFLGVWGSGVLEFDIAGESWKHYLDPDGEMEIDLYRDDGIVHVITTGVSAVDEVLWVTTYFGASRYDGRHWRGYYADECGAPSDFHNAVQGRSAHEAWFSTDRGLGVLADFATDTWVTYTADQEAGTGRAVVQRGSEELAVVETGPSLPHNYVLWTEIDGNDVWVGTAKGLAHGIAADYYPRLRPVAGGEGE